MAERLITIQQLCDLLHVSRSTVDRWRREGLPFTRVGRGIRFREVEALAWVENKSRK